MHGLPCFHQKKVCGIYYIINRPHSHRLQLFNKPCRGGAHLNIPDHPAGIPRTKVFILYPDADTSVLYAFFPAAIFEIFRYFQLFSRYSGDLARDAQNTQTIVSIRCYLKIEHKVVAYFFKRGYMHTRHRKHLCQVARMHLYIYVIFKPA